MSRQRIYICALAGLALLLAACEIRTDYDLDIASDGSAVMQFDIVYDSEAASLFGPAASFLTEIEQDTEGDIDGVRVLSAEADGSDPDAQRVSVTLAADNATALNELMIDNFNGSFTSEGGDSYRLTAVAEEDAGDFGDFGDMGDFPLDMEFIVGELTLNHAGTQVSMSGGESTGGNTVIWDPFGAEDLEIVMELSGATPPAGGDADTEQPAEEPAVEEPAVEEAPADDEGSASDESVVEEPVTDEVEESAADAAADELDAEAAAAEGDDEGMSTVTLAAIIGGILLAIIIAVVVAMVMRKGKGDEQQVPAYADGPAAQGAAQQGYYPPPGYDQTQQQGYQQPQQQYPQQGYDQTQQQGYQQPQQQYPQQGYDQQQPPVQPEPPAQQGYDQTQQQPPVQPEPPAWPPPVQPEPPAWQPPSAPPTDGQPPSDGDTQG